LDVVIRYVLGHGGVKMVVRAASGEVPPWSSVLVIVYVEWLVGVDPDWSSRKEHDQSPKP
jgi:hypothetical protein